MKKKGGRRKKNRNSVQRKKRASYVHAQRMKHGTRSSRQKTSGFFSSVFRFFERNGRRSGNLHISDEKKRGNKVKREFQGEQSVIRGIGRYRTPLDDLFMLVQERGTVPLSEVAKRFKISERLAEEWAKILENGQLLSIHYPAFGSPILMKWENTNEGGKGGGIHTP